jgi:hypothetical protein
VEWLKVKALNSSPRTAKKKIFFYFLAGCQWLMPIILATQRRQGSGSSRFEANLGK